MQKSLKMEDFFGEVNLTLPVFHLLFWSGHKVLDVDQNEIKY